MNLAATTSCPTKSPVRSSVISELHPLFAPRSPTPVPVLTVSGVEGAKAISLQLRVSQTAIEAWIDEDQVVNLPTANRAISIRSEMEECRPLGIATWSTTAALRKIRVRPL